MVFVILACLGLAVRLPRLAERPMHTDEAVNAYIVGAILSGGTYHYDGRDRHGPALAALAVPFAHAAGARNLADLNESQLRLVPVFIGAIAILLFALVAQETGLLAASVAALLWAFAPLPLYYSRYFIHETLFVTATLGFLLSGWRSIVAPSATSRIFACTLTGFCAGLMLACKETALLSFAAAGIAALTAAKELRTPRNPRISFREQSRLNWRTATAALSAGFIAFLAVVLIFYSWGGRHWQGLSDLGASLPRLLERASGEGHSKPAWYYLKLLGDGMTGWPVLLLAIIGGGINLRLKSETGPSFSLRTLVVYTVVIFALYNAIPYKTPWLALNLWLPLSVLAGCGFSALWEAAKPMAARWGLVAVTLLFAAMLGHDSWQRVFAKPSDESNPYAYAHTVEDLLRLPGRIDQLAGELGKNSATIRIAVVAADPWPLPWYLRRLPAVGYWQLDQDPGSADLYLTSPEAAELLSSRLKGWRPEFFGIRPGVLAILWTRPLQALP
jgi:uncharacterized protein (TIGR03663 family)